MNLPRAFLTRMEEKLGTAFPDFLHSYEVPPVKGLRVNALKISKEEFEKITPFALEQVAWEKNGYYVTEGKPGAHPYHFAGLYYCQEPSAMCAVPMLGVEKGDMVLDACSAPGGKTTQLAVALGGTGLLVANEYEYERANILSQNVERMGVRNAVVVSADTGKLAEKLAECFDKILVDAPCSGEGMFKKEENAIPEWSEENVVRCARRQAEILDNAVKMLKKGGRMVYSTCTFAPLEDEEQIADFLARHPEMKLIDEKKLYPHEVKGEGHFSALLEKMEGGETEIPLVKMKADKSLSAVKAFLDDFLTVPLPMERIECTSTGVVRLLPERLPRTLLEGKGGIAKIRVGLELGTWDGKLFKPSHSFAMALRREEVKSFVSLTVEESEKYLHGDTVECDLPNGWCVVGVDGYSLGIGKIVGGVVKNHLPKGIRKVK